AVGVIQVLNRRHALLAKGQSFLELAALGQATGQPAQVDGEKACTRSRVGPAEAALRAPVRRAHHPAQELRRVDEVSRSVAGKAQVLARREPQRIVLQGAGDVTGPLDEGARFGDPAHLPETVAELE